MKLELLVVTGNAVSNQVEVVRALREYCDRVEANHEARWLGTDDIGRYTGADGVQFVSSNQVSVTEKHITEWVTAAHTEPAKDVEAAALPVTTDALNTGGRSLLADANPGPAVPRAETEIERVGRIDAEAKRRYERQQRDQHLVPPSERGVFGADAPRGTNLGGAHSADYDVIAVSRSGNPERRGWIRASERVERPGLIYGQTRKASSFAAGQLTVLSLQTIDAW